MSLPRIIGLLMPIADALDVLHALGWVVHRCVKPSDIVLAATPAQADRSRRVRVVCCRALRAERRSLPCIPRLQLFIDEPAFNEPLSQSPLRSLTRRPRRK